MDKYKKLIAIGLSAFAVNAGLGINKVLACSVCFGAANSPTGVGLKLGVITLLMILLCVLVSFAWFFIGLRKRSS